LSKGADIVFVDTPLSLLSILTHLFILQTPHSLVIMAASQSEIQEKISAARRQADSLKDQIRAAKDQTADTSRA
jgi:hypothetical protein